MPIAGDRHRCFWRMALARLMAFVVFLALVAPLPAAASGGSAAPASPAITSTTSDLGDSADDVALVQHVHCPFHQNAAGPNPVSPAVVIAIVRNAFPAWADAAPRSRPAALPFKPPRA